MDLGLNFVRCNSLTTVSVYVCYRELSVRMTVECRRWARLAPRGCGRVPREGCRRARGEARGGGGAARAHPGAFRDHLN